MRFLINVSLCAALVGFPYPALADVTVKISGEDRSTSIEGSAQVEARETPMLKGGVAEFHGNSLDFHLQQKTKEGEAEVLKGVVLKPELSRSAFKGYVVLTKLTAQVPTVDGTSTASIDDPEVEELIEVEGGQLVSGHITEISDEGIKIAEKTVPLNKIVRLCSPRVLEFECALVASKEALANGFEAHADKLTVQRTTSPVTDKNGKVIDEKKRCCKFPPLMLPPIPPPKGGHHIHIVIPI